ncbi:D-alanyl-D-alanine carboxypeptidase [Clostridia bacterium]|nr:D-alanyl-D-alanine carboxypeptidase [Clostridia bacterium]
MQKKRKNVLNIMKELFHKRLLVFILCMSVWCNGILSFAAPEDIIGETSTSTDWEEEQDALTVEADVQQQGQVADLGLLSRSAILMEASTGTTIYEQDADLELNPASVTKVMTLLLIFDALARGSIQLTDEVATSEYAKSMGGSQVFLETGEIQTVETLIKCIVIASGNDASVAMAEFIGGSETEFVRQMNERAASLGMQHTHFVDCCGLTDSPDHYTSARDIALMSRELITKYPEITKYSTIWMETITHRTNQGNKDFVLSNTNKLLKQYQGITGLKTGSTSIAKYCLSATAKKDDLEMIAVIMAAPDYKVRFKEAAQLLDYGYANCRIYLDENPGDLEVQQIVNGAKDQVKLRYAKPFSYVSVGNEDFSQIEKQWIYSEKLEAPIEEGKKAGSLVYTLGGKEIGSVDILTAESIAKAQYIHYVQKLWDKMQL